jgi:rare lipoprotein A
MPWQQPVVQPLARHERPSSWRTVIVPAAPEAMAVFAPGGRITTAALPPEGRQGAAPPRPLVGVAHKLEGIASYYWQDQMTASGEVFDKRAMTAAHPTLPLGTRVRVTHLASGRTVVVRINDRGPFVAGRIVDLSLGAAEVIGMTGAGLARVRLDVLP